MPLLPPLLIKQWHHKKNIIPVETVTPGSGRKVWWLGDCGHEWEARVADRVSGKGCPVCSGRIVLPGFNDLSTTHPEVANQWDFGLNAELTPTNVSAGSNRKVWWLGSCGHSWEATVMSRARGSICPYCSNRAVLPSFNDLSTTHPEIAAQWDSNKNSFSPSEVTAGSAKKAWWNGNCGHSWESVIYSRAKGVGCPYCSHQKVGDDSISFTHPEVASLWHALRNNDVEITDVSAGSNRKVWWICREGHEWEARVADVVSSSQSFFKGCPYCKGNKIGDNSSFKISFPQVSLEWHPFRNALLKPEDFSCYSNKKVWWLGDCGHEWEARVADRASGKGCRKCTPQISSAEKEIHHYLETFKLDILPSDKTVIPPQEIDLYLPSKRIGIEFNGLYWHDEKRKLRNYHHDKWVAAKEAGVQLIQIWEDDWKRNPELVKRMLAHKLGVSQEPTVYARKTAVVEISKSETATFLNQYHIQGHSNGSYYVGLRDNDSKKIVAVLVLKKEPGTDGRTLNIIRYATSCNVTGGFTKLLTYAERTYLPEAFVTFADHCVSDGGLYENNGFVADKELPPDYMYVVKSERKHKFNYRLKRFCNDPTLKFEEGLTERELASLNNIPRIWDAGKTRYIKTLHSGILEE